MRLLPCSSKPWTALLVSYCHKVHAWTLPGSNRYRGMGTTTLRHAAPVTMSTVSQFWSKNHGAAPLRSISTMAPYSVTMQRSWSPIPTSTTTTTRNRHHGSYLKARGSKNNYDDDDDENDLSPPSFQVGDKVQVEVISFGPLGASVGVVGIGHGDAIPLLPVDAEPYGMGLISQQEIAYFRQARGNVDVVRGEVLPAFIQKIREEDGKLDIGLRAFGGKAKADELSSQIVSKLQSAPGGILPVGDKSSPEEISKEFPGVSKAVFKKAIGALYKQGVVAPSANSITLLGAPSSPSSSPPKNANSNKRTDNNNNDKPSRRKRQ